MSVYSNIWLFAILFGAFFLFLIFMTIVGEEMIVFEEGLALISQCRDEECSGGEKNTE